MIDHALQTALGNIRQLRHRDPQIIQRQRQGLAMEVAAGDDITILCEDERVVRHRVELRLNHTAHMRQRVTHRPMHLRHAAQGVGVLHPQAFRCFDQGAIHAKRADIGCHRLLPLVRANGVHALVKGVHPPLQRFHREAHRDIGQLADAFRVIQRKRAHCAHGLGAVDERQAFLGQQALCRNPRLVHCRLPGHHLALVLRLTITQQHQRQVRKRCQIPRRAQRALFRHNRMNTCIEHLDQVLYQKGADSGISLAEGVGAQQHHGADNFRRKGITAAHRVA